MYYKPVAVDKAEIKVETIKVAGEDEVFYKAYAHDNTPVAVPASSLEAMRTMVNLRIRRREDSTVAKFTNSKSKKEFKRYLKKLEDLTLKLDQYDKDEGLEEERMDGRYSSIPDAELVCKKLDKLPKKTSKDLLVDKKQTKTEFQTTKKSDNEKMGGLYYDKSSLPRRKTSEPKRQSISTITDSSLDSGSSVNNYSKCLKCLCRFCQKLWLWCSERSNN